MGGRFIHGRCASQDYIPGSFIPDSFLPKLALPICLNIFFIWALAEKASKLIE
jgi:hypothetical protein